MIAEAVHVTSADRAALLRQVLDQYAGRLHALPPQLQPDLIQAYCPDDANSPGLLSLAALPFWIGESLGLPYATCLEIAVGNLFLLHSFQSYDFIVDQDRPQTDYRHQVILGGLCYQEVMRSYQPLLADYPAFWERLPVYWQEWGESLLWEPEPAEGRRPFTEQQMFVAAHKAAALKMCPTGLALLAGRPDLIRAYEAAVDWMHAVMQLVDDLQDWQEDLQHQRFNAFLGLIVANRYWNCAGHPGSAEIQAIIQTTPILEQYGALISDFAGRGRAAMEVLEIPPWSMLLDGLATQGWWLAATINVPSERQVQAVADPVFRQKLLEDPEVTVKAARSDLSPEQMKALKEWD